MRDTGESGEMFTHCLFAHWAPGFTTLSLFGEVMIVAYLAAAWFCRRQAVSAWQARGLWTSAEAALGILAVDRFFDLHSLFTVAGRCTSLFEGWWSGRRPVQETLFGVILFAAVIVLTALFIGLRREPLRLRIVLFATTILVVLMLLRALSLHDVDAALSMRLFGLKMRDVVEAGALAASGLAAWPPGKGLAHERGQKSRLHRH